MDLSREAIGLAMLCRPVHALAVGVFVAQAAMALLREAKRIRRTTGWALELSC